MYSKSKITLNHPSPHIPSFWLLTQQKPSLVPRAQRSESFQMATVLGRKPPLPHKVLSFQRVDQRSADPPFSMPFETSSIPQFPTPGSGYKRDSTSPWIIPSNSCVPLFKSYNYTFVQLSTWASILKPPEAIQNSKPKPLAQHIRRKSWFRCFDFSTISWPSATCGNCQDILSFEGQKVPHYIEVVPH